MANLILEAIDSPMLMSEWWKPGQPMSAVNATPQKIREWNNAARIPTEEENARHFHLMNTRKTFADLNFADIEHKCDCNVGQCCEVCQRPKDAGAL